MRCSFILLSACAIKCYWCGLESCAERVHADHTVSILLSAKCIRWPQEEIINRPTCEVNSPQLQINQNPVIMRIFTSHSVPDADYKEALFTACLCTKKKGTRFVYISWSVNCLKMLALKEFLKSNFSYLKAFSQTQGDLFSTVRHAMPVLEVPFQWLHTHTDSLS